MSVVYFIPCALAEGTQTSILNPQVADVLKTTSVFFVENVRSARRFISSCRLGITIEDLTFEVVDKKTCKDSIRSLFQKHNSNIGVISEAGCPGIADPGAVIAEVAHEKNIDVIPLVGPSSLLLALMASGQNGQEFTFHGYLPIDKKERVDALKNIERTINQKSSSHLFIETPYRNNQMIDSITESVSGGLRLTIAVDITGAEEMIKTKNVGDWKNKKPDIHKRPAIFILGK